MSGQGIILVGGPDSGKTNYLARLWAALRSGNGAVRAATTPSEIGYVEAAVAHLLQGNFAPRTELGLDIGRTEFVIPVHSSNSPEGEPVEIMVPDVSGELWKVAVENNELEQAWMDKVEGARGALLFVRVGSDQNVEALDWVTSAGLLRMQAGAVLEHPLSTQVTLCQLVKFLEERLGKEGEDTPRVAILVTAWDRLDIELQSVGPTAFVAAQYPLLSGRLRYGTALEVKVFGVSVVGGDFIDDDFTADFLNGDLLKSGYIVQDSGGSVERISDVTRPIAWILSGEA